MKNIVKVAVLVGTILFCMAFCSLGVVAEETEFPYNAETQENIILISDFGYVASSSVLELQNQAEEIIPGDHGDDCYAYNGQIRVAGIWMNCECVDLNVTPSVSVHVYTITQNFDWGTVDTTMDEDYPNATRIFNATEDYNCHSYAWYCQDPNVNNYWMCDTTPYYFESGLFTQVYSPSEGDIICYFDDNGDNQHSGIVVSPGPTVRTTVVQSKWGVAGVYEHLGKDCPYRNYTDIRYYRRTGHSHTYTGIYNIAEQQHGWQCTDSSCGQIIWTDDHYYQHDFVNTGSGSTHTGVCACGDTITQSHSFEYQTYNENFHKKYCDCGYNTYVAHSYDYSYTNAQVHTKTCSLCDASYQDPHYEEVYSVEDNGDGSHDIMCICQGIFDEDANHVYNEYDYYNGVYHMISCICGDYELEAHELSYDNFGSYHAESCEICGYYAEPDHTYTSTKSYYDLNHHKAYCGCGDYIIELHDEYTVKSYNSNMHTLQLTCCGTRTVTNWHTYEDYDSDSHTGDCIFCNHTLTTDQAHTDGNYLDNGNGTHTNKCNYCGYSHTEYHTYVCWALDEETHQRYCSKCDLEQIVEEHTWDDDFDEDGNWYPFCTGCGYELDVELLSLDMIDKLPGEIQSALQSAPQNALQSTQADGTETAYYVIQIDDNTGILYLNGEYYLVHYPEIPDVELEPTPSIPGEESVS